MNDRRRIPYRTAFVINPAGGGGNAGKVWPSIAKLLDQWRQPYKAYFTRVPGEGTILAQKAVAGGAELVVAVGGDGTVREIINGIDLNSTVFGIIPLGTGNGFRRSCHIPGRWEQALNGLTQWMPRCVDVGEINGSYFLNVVGIGFDAAVAETAAGKYCKIKGYMAYLPAFFNELMSFKHFSAEIKTNNSLISEDNVLLAVIANGQYYGGVFAIAPQAVIDDGSLDLILVRKRNNPETTLLALQALAKRHLDSSAVVTAKGTKFSISADHVVPVHIDGEVVGTLPAEIIIKPAALRMLLPPR